MAKRILVVDDEPDIRRLVAEALQVTGYDVQSAASGSEAIRAAAQYIPDLVLLDIMMPDMDGFTVYERLRAKPVELRSPIIFLTARRDINDKLLGFEKGAADYITKPFHIKELLARVKVHLGELGPPKGDTPNPLTDRELEVLGLLAGGKTYKQVARALDLSQSTVRNHLAQRVPQVERRRPRPGRHREPRERLDLTRRGRRSAFALARRAVRKRRTACPGETTTTSR